MITPHLLFHSGNSSCTPFPYPSILHLSVPPKCPLQMSSRPEPQEPEESVATGSGSHFPTWTHEPKWIFALTRERESRARVFWAKTPIFLKIQFLSIICEVSARRRWKASHKVHPWSSEPQGCSTQCFLNWGKAANLKIKIVLTGQHGSTWMNMVTPLPNGLGVRTPLSKQVIPTTFERLSCENNLKKV